MFGVLSIIQRAYIRREESKAYEERCVRERFERQPSGPLDIFNTIKSFDITLERHTNIWNDLVDDDSLAGVVDQAASSGKVFFVPNVKVSPAQFARHSSFESTSTTSSASADSRRCSVDSLFSIGSASTAATSIHDTAGKKTVSDLPIFTRFARALSTAAPAEVHLTLIPSTPPSRRNAIVKRHQGKKLASGRFKQCQATEVPSSLRPIRRNALRGLACKTKAKLARRGAVLDRGAKVAHHATKAKLVRRGAVLDKARKAKPAGTQNKSLLPVYPSQLSQHWCMAETSQKQRRVNIVGWDKDPDHGLARAEDYAAELVEQDGLKGKGRYSEIPLEFREKYMSPPPPPVAKTVHAKAKQHELLPSQHWCLAETSQKSRRVHIVGWDKDPDHGLARAEDYAAGLVEQDGLKGKGRYSKIPLEFREKYMSPPSPRNTVVTRKVLSPEDRKRYSPVNHLGWEEYDRVRFMDWRRRHQNLEFGMKRKEPLKCPEIVQEYFDLHGRVICKATTRTYIL